MAKTGQAACPPRKKYCSLIKNILAFGFTVSKGKKCSNFSE
jgi:hypothetical protein